MKLPAPLIFLTITMSAAVLLPVGAYANPGARDSLNPSARPRQSPAPASAGPPEDAPKLTPRQTAELRADILNARKDYLAAAEAYEDILKADPRNAPLLNKVGVAYQSLGDSDLAARYYKKAMHADKNFGTAINNLGTLEYSDERYATAIKYYKKALGHETDRATVYSNLGYAYSANREYPKALDAFAKVLAIDPLYFTHHGGAGTLIAQRTPLDPGMLFFLLAKSYAKIGDVDRTVQYLKIARDDGYKNFAAAAKDADFAPVIQNARVREALQLPPLVPPGAKAPS